MKQILTLTLIFATIFFTTSSAGKNIFSVIGNKTYLNGKEFLCIGLRCSNSLLSDETTEALIQHLDFYKDNGINTISVFIMGSRFSDIKGYNADGTLNPIYSKRMAKIIEACDEREMVVLVGCLYWGESKGKWEHWKQNDANTAIVNTVKWLSEKNFRNVFIDPDNEGMAHRAKGFNIEQMIASGKKINPKIPIGFNYRELPPANADLALHHANKLTHIPYIESEGSPEGYWNHGWSKKSGLYDYINIGIYTEEQKRQQIEDTERLLKNGMGYMFASSWLQCVPPNYHPGGDGNSDNPGFLWWLEYIKNNYK